jgi:hypothetical protein
MRTSALLLIACLITACASPNAGPGIGEGSSPSLSSGESILLSGPIEFSDQAGFEHAHSTPGGLFGGAQKWSGGLRQGQGVVTTDGIQFLVWNKHENRYLVVYNKKFSDIHDAFMDSFGRNIMIVMMVRQGGSLSFHFTTPGLVDRDKTTAALKIIRDSRKN